jgi:Zn-dependent protease
LKLLLSLFAGAKLGKIFLSGGSMLVSIVAYSWIFGWAYAFGLVLLLYIHEAGHLIAAKQKGIATSLPMFIPFVGAWITMKELPYSVNDEAYIGFAGPLVGTVGALICYYIARYYDSSLLLAISYSGFFINLFNLIPISPLDGGRIVAIISPKIWLVGIPILAIAFFYLHSPLLIFIIILAFPQLIKAWKHDVKNEEDRLYYKTTMEQRISYTIYYLSLVLFLTTMVYEIHKTLERTISI